MFGIHGRSAEQRIALEILLDPEVGIVSLGGRAGTGKSAMALCAGLEAVLERNQHKKVVVFRPLFAVGGQELGYLPGSESEKMSPWGQAVFDTLSSLTSREVIEELLERGMLEVLPLTHIRGRSLHDSFVIVDEAQSLERNVLLTVLSRIGANSKVVLTHDVAQRDNLRVGRHDGVVAVVEKLKGHPLFAHVTLTRSERSPIAALVTELLEEHRAPSPAAHTAGFGFAIPLTRNAWWGEPRRQHLRHPVPGSDKHVPKHRNAPSSTVVKHAPKRALRSVLLMAGLSAHSDGPCRLRRGTGSRKRSWPLAVRERHHFRPPTRPRLSPVCRLRPQQHP